MPIKIVPRKPQPKDIGREERKKASRREAIDMRKDAQRERSMAKGMLSGGQAKLDKNKNNKIDAEDFALLRKEKKGRPMKAKRGQFSDTKKGFSKAIGQFPAIKTAPGSMASKAEAASKMGSAKEAVKKSLRRRFQVGAALATGIGGAIGTGINALKNLKKKRAAKKRDEAKVKKMGGGMMKKYNKGGTPMYLTDEKIKEVFPEKGATSRARISQLVGGDRVSPMKGDRFEAGQKSRRKKMLKEFGKKVVRAALPGAGAVLAAKKAKGKISGKMGGGMMQRPMGMGMAKKGKMIKARGGGMARTKPTSMY